MTVPEREVIALEAAAARSEVAVAKPLSSWLDQRRLLIGAAVIAGLVAPLVVANFTIFQLTMVMIYGLAILGLNLVTGFNGQFSLGHSAFYGIGAYTAAILMSGSAELAYYWTLPCAGAASLVRSRTGRAIMAIRDHPTAAAAMGIDTARYKTLTFGVSALYTGVAGALGAIVVQFVAPDSFSFLLSVSFLVGLIVGGIGSIPGSLLGGVFVLFVPNLAEKVSTGLSGAVYGVILLLLIFVMPSGAAGFARQSAAWLVRQSGRRT